MSLEIRTGYLKRILRVARVVHPESECRIGIDTDGLSLRAHSIDRTAYLDYSIPFSDSFTPPDEETGDVWVKLQPIKRFLNIVDDANIELIFPFETPKSTVILESDRFVYRSESLIVPSGHYLPSDVDSTPVTTCSFSHVSFKRAVRVADWLGREVEIQINPDTRHIEFSAAGDRDSYTYIVPREDVDVIHGSTTTFTASIAVLTDFIGTIPNSTRITIRLTPDYLEYRATYPSDAILRLCIARVKEAIPG